MLTAAAARGLQLSINVVPTALTSAWIAALCGICWRYSRPSSEQRLAASAGIVILLFAGGAFGGLICLVGQTFALPLIDPQLHQADLALGIDLKSIIAGVIKIPGLAPVLAAAYASSIPMVFLTALLFVWTGRRERAWELCFVFNLCLTITALSATVTPAAGPFHYLPIPPSLQHDLPPGAGIYALNDLFSLRSSGRFIVDPTDLRGVATFPSFHAMLALMTAAAWRDVGKMGLLMSAWQGTVILSTLPIGGHYGIDLIAGLACWAVVQFLWSTLRRKPQSRRGAINQFPAAP